VVGCRRKLNVFRAAGRCLHCATARSVRIPAAADPPTGRHGWSGHRTESMLQPLPHRRFWTTSGAREEGERLPGPQVERHQGRFREDRPSESTSTTTTLAPSSRTTTQLQASTTITTSTTSTLPRLRAPPRRAPARPLQPPRCLAEQLESMSRSTVRPATERHPSRNPVKRRSTRGTVCCV
jgi:hypothetical protein